MIIFALFSHIILMNFLYDDKLFCKKNRSNHKAILYGMELQKLRPSLDYLLDNFCMIFTRILTHYCDMLKSYCVREKIDRIIIPACLFDDGIVLQKLRSSIDYLLAPFCMTRTFYCDWKAEFCDALTSCTFSLEKLLRAEQRKKRRRACGRRVWRSAAHCGAVAED